MNKICFYEGHWYVFSNSSSFKVYWKGIEWMTAEHAYQASKFTDKKIIKLICAAPSAHDAKKIAKAHKEIIRPGWQEAKVRVMEDILRAKLNQHPYAQKKLIESGNAKIVEDSPRDAFWGIGPNGDGENHLGRIWMKLRTEILKEG